MEASAEGRSGGGRRRAGRFDILDQLNIIAHPRLTGSEAAVRVTNHILATLSGFEYDVRALAFRFNPWPARIGVSVLGGCYLVAAIGTGALLYYGRALAALGVLGVYALLAGVAIGLVRPFLDRSRWALRDGVNLLAMPPGGRPKYLIVAHRDSKSQPVPLSLRGPAIALALLSWLLLLVFAVLSMAQPVARILSVAATVLAAAAGFTLLFCWTGNSSPGALDNASGVATLLAIAQEQRGPRDVALLVTDAEELGLAGARAIAGSLPTVIGAINLDGIDDTGPFYLMERFGWPRKHGRAAHLAAALLRAGAELRLDVRRRDTPFGIMLDHMPLVVGGTPALTIMRGSVNSLRRVHRPGDDLANLRGQGIAPTMRLVSRALALLRAQEPAVRRA